MTKYQLTRPDGPYSYYYPTFGFRAATGAILDGSLYTPAITEPPDVFWSVYTGGSAQTGITLIEQTSTPANVAQTPQNYLPVYKRELGTYLPTSPAEVFALPEVAAGLSASYARGLTVTDAAFAGGAKGDGTTDDTAAIQAAINAAAALGGGVVFFPRKATPYRAANLVLKAGVSLVSLAGMFGFLPDGKGGGPTIKANAAGWVIDATTGAQVMSVIGLNIDGNGQAGGIRFTNASWSRIAQCGFNNTDRQAVWLRNTNAAFSVGIVLEDLLIVNAVMNRAQTARIGVVEVEGTDHFLNRIESSASIPDSTVADATNLWITAFFIKGANHFISNLVGEFADVGMWDQSTDTRHSDLRMDHNGGHGYVANGSGSWVNIDSFWNALAANNTYDGWQANYGGNVVTNLRVTPFDPGGKTYRYGLRDTMNTGGGSHLVNHYSNLNVRGGATKNVDTVDFLGSTVAWAPAFTQTQFQSPADSTTPDVYGFSHVLLTHGAGVAITDFLNGTVGQTIYVRANSAVTIANNANIQTSTNATKTLDPKRVYSFTRWLGKWCEIGNT